MQIHTPYFWIPERRLRIACVALCVLSVVLFGVMTVMGAPIDRVLAHGIIDVESPWSPAGAAQIHAELGAAGIDAVRRQTMLDFVFLLAYPQALAMLCVLAIRSLPLPLTGPARWALGMSWAVLAAIPLDVFENICMLRLIDGDFAAPLPQLSSMAALLKFLLVVATIIVLVFVSVERFRLGWWSAKILTLVRLNIFTLLSLLIGVYFLGLSQPGRELWEDLIGAGRWVPVLVTAVACAAWLLALLWAPQHTQLTFLVDVKARHGVDWPAGLTEDRQVVRRAMAAIPAVCLAAALVAVVFGAVTYGVAEGQKQVPLLTILLIATCAVGAISELRWPALAPAERRSRARRRFLAQCAWGALLWVLILVIQGVAEWSASGIVRSLLPAVVPTLLACTAAWWIGREAAPTLAKVLAIGALRCVLSVVVVLVWFEGAAEMTGLAAAIVVAAMLVLELVYQTARDSSSLAGLRDAQKARYLPEDCAAPPRGGLAALAPMVAGTLLFAIWPVQIGAALGSLAVVMLALAAWTMLCAAAFIALPTRLGLGAVPLALPLWFLVVSPISDNHRLPDVAAFDAPNQIAAVVQAPAASAPPPRRHSLRIDDDFEAWLASPRRSKSAATPVVIVSASGGGVRAAYWTATTLARLHDQTCGEFGRQTYAISGVSGGSVGAAVYVAAVHHLDRVLPPEKRSCTPGGAQRSELVGPTETLVRRFFEQDLMAPLLGSMLFPDAMQRFVPALIPWGDRGRALEQAMELGWARVTGGGDEFAQPMTQLYETDVLRALPILVFNSTNVADGRRVQASPILLRDPQAYPLFSNEVRTKGMRLSTAAHNSARFPLMSPPGTVLTRDGQTAMRIVDGGYFENSAAAGASSLYRTLRLHPMLGNRPLALMIIENDPELDEPSTSCGLEGEQLALQALAAGKPLPVSRNPVPLPAESPRVSQLAPEVTAIIDALLGARTARAPWHQQELATQVCEHERAGHLVRGFFYRNGVHDLFEHADRHDAGKHRDAPDPALSWALSGATRQRMNLLVHSSVQRSLSGRFGVWSAWPQAVPVSQATPAP